MKSVSQTKSPRNVVQSYKVWDVLTKCLSVFHKARTHYMFSVYSFLFVIISVSRPRCGCCFSTVKQTLLMKLHHHCGKRMVCFLFFFKPTSSTNVFKSSVKYAAAICTNMKSRRVCCFVSPVVSATSYKLVALYHFFVCAGVSVNFPVYSCCLR